MADIGVFGVTAWYGKQVQADVDAEVVRRFHTLARELKPVIEGYTPVRSGKLKAGYRLEVDASRKEIIITNEQAYFIYVEMGTSRMVARAMVRRALAAYSGRASSLLGSTNRGGTLSRATRGIRRLFGR